MLETFFDEAIPTRALEDFLWCVHYSNVGEVLTAMEQFGIPRSIVIGTRVHSLPRDSDTVSEYTGWNERAEACDVKDISFWGGPNRKVYYTGLTLQDFMDDMVLSMVVTYGLDKVKQSLDMEYV